MTDTFGNPPQNPNPQPPSTPPPPGQGVPPQGGQPGSMPGQPPASGVNPQWQSHMPANGANEVIGEPASGGARVGARIVDSLVMLFLYLPYMLVVALIFAGLMTAMYGMEGNVTSEDMPLPLKIFLVVLIYGLPFLNEVVLTSKAGGNIGKLILGLRVVDAETKQYMSFGEANKRFLVLFGPQFVFSLMGFILSSPANSLASLLGIIYWIVLAVTIFRASPTFQGAHDKFADVLVVKKQKQF